MSLETRRTFLANVVSQLQLYIENFSLFLSSDWPYEFQRTFLNYDMHAVTSNIKTEFKNVLFNYQRMENLCKPKIIVLFCLFIKSFYIFIMGIKIIFYYHHHLRRHRHRHHNHHHHHYYYYCNCIILTFTSCFNDLLYPYVILYIGKSFYV